MEGIERKPRPAKAGTTPVQSYDELSVPYNYEQI